MRAWLSLAAVPLLAWLFWRYEARLYQAQGAPLLNPAALRAPGLGRALLGARLNDEVLWQRPAGDQVIEVIRIEPA